MPTLFLIIIAVSLVSLISLVGLATLAWSKLFTKKIISLLVGLSAGTLIGDSFLHLMPEAVESAGENLLPWYGLIIGFGIFFLLEKIIHWRHCHHETTDQHPHPVGLMNLIGDSLHNFMDGILIAGSFLISPALGISTSIAVISHELPQEIGDFGILLHAGYEKKKALWLNFLTALTAIFGALITYFIGKNLESIINFIVPITAGGFLYIAASDLIPEMKKHENNKQSINQILAFMAGLIIMFLLKYFLE